MTQKLGDILIRQGVIDEDKLIAALSDQRAFGGKLGRTLVDLGYITEDHLVAALAQQLGLEPVDLSQASIMPEALSCLPVDACERYGVFPVRVDHAKRLLWVATAEPDLQTLQEVARIAQMTLEPLLSSLSAIDRAVRQHYFGERAAAPTRLGETLKGIPESNGQQPPVAAAAAKPAPLTAVPAPQRGDAIEELKTLILRLERGMDAQGRAFRALVELLQEKGVVRRGELGARASSRKTES